MKQTLAVTLALASYIVLLLTSLNVLAVAGLAFIVLASLYGIVKAITAIIEHRHTVTSWRAE